MNYDHNCKKYDVPLSVIGKKFKLGVRPMAPVGVPSIPFGPVRTCWARSHLLGQSYLLGLLHLLDLLDLLLPLYYMNI